MFHPITAAPQITRHRPKHARILAQIRPHLLDPLLHLLATSLHALKLEVAFLELLLPQYAHVTRHVVCERLVGDQVELNAEPVQDRREPCEHGVGGEG